MKSEYERILAEPASLSTVYDRLKKEAKPTTFQRIEPISVDLFKNGQVTFEQLSLAERQAFVADQLNAFGGFEKLIEQNLPYPVYLTPECF